MLLNKLTIALLFLLTANLPAFADDSQPDLLSQVKFNMNVVNTNSEASTFLHSISLMENDDVDDVKYFMEYKLDKFVCESWKNQEKMNSSQKKIMMEILYKIKKHREINPRNAWVIVDPQKFYKYFEPYEASNTKCADDILADLK